MRAFQRPRSAFYQHHHQVYVLLYDWRITFSIFFREVRDGDGTGQTFSLDIDRCGFLPSLTLVGVSPHTFLEQVQTLGRDPTGPATGAREADGGSAQDSDRAARTGVDLARDAYNRLGSIIDFQAKQQVSVRRRAQCGRPS